MASDIEIRDGSSYLFVRAMRKGVMLEGVLSALFAVVVVLFVGWRFLRWPLLLLLSAIVAGADLWYVVRTKIAELKITNLEFTSRAYVEGWCGPTRSIPRADIKWLEYQEDTTGPDGQHPGGLYAVLRHRNVCLLPHINEQQTGVVIERIIRKFPDFDSQWKGQSPFGTHFTTLGLNQTIREK